MKPFTNLQRRQIAAALASHRYEFDDNHRVFVPEHKLSFGGVFTVDVNGADRSVADNLAVDEGLIDLLTVYFKSGSATATFYLAPFVANVTPASNLTAATFNSTLTEFTNYAESTRVPWELPGAALATPSASNTASPAVFTVNVDAQTVCGLGLLTASAKQATTGKLVAAALLPKAKHPDSGDTLNATYTFNATST